MTNLSAKHFENSNTEMKKILNLNSKRLRKRLENENDENVSTQFQYEESIQFNQQSESNIEFIKQKYKLYLDWLDENCLKNYGQQSHQQSQLNWYNYEQTFNSNQSSYLKYLENINHTNRNRSMNNLNSINQNTNENKRKIRSKSHTKNTKTNQLNLSNESSLGLNSNLSINSTPDLKQIKEMKKNSLIKGVKFETIDSNFKVSNYLNSQTYNGANYPIKPILKSNSQTNENYYSSSKASKKASIPHDSVLSISSNNSYNNNRSISSAGIKLPPIVRCSDDFYAVLNEMEKNRFV